MKNRTGGNGKSQHQDFIETIWKKMKSEVHVNNAVYLASLSSGNSFGSEELNCMRCPDFGHYFDYTGEVMVLSSEKSRM